MKIIAASHTHNISADLIALIARQYEDRQSFFIETFQIPESYPEVDCALYGPAMDDPPIKESAVRYGNRSPRLYASRLTGKPVRKTRSLVVIAGPDGDEPCVLYTMFGGPGATPKEPEDPTLDVSEREQSIRFWSEHALACSPAEWDAAKPRANETARKLMKTAADAMRKGTNHSETANLLRMEAASCLDAGDLAAYGGLVERANLETTRGCNAFNAAEGMIVLAQLSDHDYALAIQAPYHEAVMRVLVEQTPDADLETSLAHALKVDPDEDRLAVRLLRERMEKRDAR